MDHRTEGAANRTIPRRVTGRWLIRASQERDGFRAISAAMKRSAWPPPRPADLNRCISYGFPLQTKEHLAPSIPQASDPSTTRRSQWRIVVSRRPSICRRKIRQNLACSRAIRPVPRAYMDPLDSGTPSRRSLFFFFLCFLCGHIFYLGAIRELVMRRDKALSCAGPSHSSSKKRYRRMRPAPFPYTWPGRGYLSQCICTWAQPGTWVFPNLEFLGPWAPEYESTQLMAS